MAACVFYTLFFDRSPVRLPGMITVNGREAVNLPSATARLLQQMAFEAVQHAQR